jgi:hypothetical protein
MRYLRYFEVDADYHAFKDSDRFKGPNVSIIEETSLCYFSPYIAPPANEIYGVIEITENNVNMPINLLYEDDGNGVKIPFNSNKIKAMRINNQKVTPTSTYTFDTPVAGEGRFIHTYMHDGNPLPSFEGEPKWVEIDGTDIDAFTASVWESLNADNKVSLFVRFIDIETGKYETRIINKNV